MSNRRKLNLAKLARVLGGDLQRTYGGTVTREQLDQLNRAAITRNVRAIVDRPGRIPQRLLDDLAGIADAHAADTAGSATVADRPPARRPRKAAAT